MAARALPRRLRLGVALVLGAFALASCATIADVSDEVPTSVVPDFTLQPTFGSVELETGFTPDPFTTDVVAGGSISLQELNADYRGYVAQAPDYSLFYEAGTFFDLFISADSSADLVLLVNGPDGSWFFNDDNQGLNPGLEFMSPMPGRYDIWIGTYSSDDFGADAVILISELGF